MSVGQAPVLVTGATGRVGRLVVDELLRAGVPVRALSRHPERAALPAAVEVLAGDFTAPESLDAALHGAGATFLVWTAPLATAPAVIERVTREARRIVYLSAPFRTPHPFFQQPNPLRELHARIEELLAATRSPLTFLRPGMFASNAVHWWAPQLREGDVVRWPYAGVETAPVDERDVAAVAALALRDDSAAANDLVLTGPESLSHAEQVRAIGDATGRPLRLEELTPDEFRREVAAAWPPAAREMLLAAWGASAGHHAYVTSSVRDVTGRPARPFAQWAADHASAFARARS